LIVPEDRHIDINLIDEAVTAGARCFKACTVLEIDVRTLQRWKKALDEQRGLEDKRKAAAAERTPANKLSNEEREAILTVCNQRCQQNRVLLAAADILCWHIENLDPNEQPDRSRAFFAKWPSSVHHKRAEPSFVTPCSSRPPFSNTGQ
jgi:transposase